MGRSPRNCAGDGGGDLVAGHVGQLLVHQQRRVGVALADQVFGLPVITHQPFLGDALELAEQVQLGVFAGVAPLGVEQALGELEQQRAEGACRPGA
ncbi:MAG: hypothetical protein V9G23_07210 [Giesbergeria sp.]